MRVTIAAVLVAALVGLPLIAVTATQFTSHLTTSEVLLGHMRRLMGDVAGETVQHVSNFLTPAEAAADLTERLAHHEVVRSDSPEDLERYFFEQLRSSPQFAGIYYGTVEGDFTYVMGDPSVEGADYRTKLIRHEAGRRSVELIWRDESFGIRSRKVDLEDQYDPRLRPWFEAALRENGLAWTEPYIFFTSQKPGITVSSPVRGPSGAMRGVVGVDIEIDDLSTFLSHLRIGEHGRAFIMNRNGDVIAFPEAEKIKQPQEESGDKLRFTRITELDSPVSRAAFEALQLPPEEIAESGPTYTSFEHEEETYHAVFVPFTNEHWPWIIGIHVPEDDYLGSIKANRRQNAALAAAIALIGCLVGFAIARSLGRRMTALSDQAGRIAEGDYEADTAPHSSFTELRNTESAFHNMISALRAREAQNAALTGELRAINQTLEQRVRERTEELRREAEEHRRTSEAFRQARDAAHAANDAKSAFLSNMSHELRTPLNVISGFAQLLLGRRKDQPPDKESEELQLIVQSANDLLALIDDVLDLAKVEAGKINLQLEPVEVAALFESTVAKFRREISLKNLGVYFSPSAAEAEREGAERPGGLRVWADERRLRQILANLVSNAVKYNVTGGEVHLRVEARGPRLARISVADSGMGIPADRQSSVFEPFNRLGFENSGVPGTGIGLSFTKRLVELMGGEIGFESDPREGTIFWVELPLADAGALAERPAAAAAEALPEGAADSPQPLGRKARILCIEDDMVSQRLVEAIFAGGNAEVLLARSGSEGLEIAATEDLDLVLLDINLPDMSGYAVLERLREQARGQSRTRPLPVVALTANAMPQEVEAGLAVGFTRYLTKPIDVQELKATVVSLAARR